MLFSPEEHPANPPESWTVTKVAERAWQLRTAAGDVLEQVPTRHEAEALKTSGHLVRLYRDEARWMAGETVANWRPFADVFPLHAGSAR